MFTSTNELNIPVSSTYIKIGTSNATRFNIPVNSIPAYSSVEAAEAELEAGDLYRLIGDSVLRIVLH